MILQLQRWWEIQGLGMPKLHDWGRILCSLRVDSLCKAMDAYILCHLCTLDCSLRQSHLVISGHLKRITLRMRLHYISFLVWRQHASPSHDDCRYSDIRLSLASGNDFIWFPNGEKDFSLSQTPPSGTSWNAPPSEMPAIQMPAPLIGSYFSFLPRQYKQKSGKKAFKFGRKASFVFSLGTNLHFRYTSFVRKSQVSACRKCLFLSNKACARSQRRSVDEEARNC